MNDCNPTTLPPLPDWLDVEAGELGASDEHEWQRAAIWKIAAESIAGACGEYCGAWVTIDPTISPYACIARWAGEDEERWRSIALELIWLDEIWANMPVGALRGASRGAVSMLFVLCHSTATQLYRALVNVAWDDWRAEYNKRREAEEVRDESE